MVQNVSTEYYNMPQQSDQVQKSGSPQKEDGSFRRLMESGGQGQDKVKGKTATGEKAVGNAGQTAGKNKGEEEPGVNFQQPCVSIPDCFLPASTAAAFTQPSFSGQTSEIPVSVPAASLTVDEGGQAQQVSQVSFPAPMSAVVSAPAQSQAEASDVQPSALLAADLLTDQNPEAQKTVSNKAGGSQPGVQIPASGTSDGKQMSAKEADAPLVPVQVQEVSIAGSAEKIKVQASDESTARQEESPIQSADVASLPSAAGTDPGDASPAKQGRDSFTGTAAQEQEKKVETPLNNEIQSYSDLYSGPNIVIKISDSQPEAKSTPVHQLTNALQDQIQQGKKEFTVDLYPQTLGKVSVKLVSENGVLTVEIAASNPKTQSLLMSGAGEIQSLLRSSTGQQIQITQPDSSAQWYGQPQDGGGNSSGGGQEEEKEDRGKRSIWAVEQTDSSMNAADFIALMRQASAS
jgi:flagellar hook-length control protein FliK